MTDKKKVIEFPDGFLWGTSVCSHQAEGYNVNSDWWAWEQKGKIRDGTVSGPASDMLNRYPEDFEFMEKIGLNAFRLGIEWARIEPRKGEYNEEALEHYDRVLAEMEKRGLKVCLTLYHWVLPKWMADEGGWTVPESVRWFRRFCRKVIPRYFDKVHLWCTLNEPTCPIIAGYIAGEFPPEKRNFFLARKAFKNLLKAHAEAYRIIQREAKKRDPEAQPLVGIAHALADFQPAKPDNPIHCKLAEFLKFFHNDCFMDALKTGRNPFPFGFNEKIDGLEGSFSYIGVNYYTRMRFHLPDKLPKKFPEDLYYLPEGTETTEMGYEVYPPGFYNVIKDMAEYGKPLYITENGIADETDAQRPSYLLRHLAQVKRAINDGIDIRGYFQWSYIDNFEWKEGFSMHFGLVAMEPETLDRLPRPSAYMYGDIAKANGITEKIVEKFAPEAADEIWGSAGVE